MQQWLLSTTPILAVGLLSVVCFCGSASADNVNIGGPKPGPTWHTDFWGWGTLQKASDKSEVKLDDSAKSRILQQYENLPDKIKEDVAVFDEKQLQEQIEKYLSAKKVAGAPNTLSEKEVSDFSWYYVSHKTALAPVRITSPTDATINMVETTGFYVSYQIDLEGGKATALVVPIKANSFSIHAKTVEGDLIWSATGATSAQLCSFWVGPSSGCSVYVNSVPENATVYFNGMQYYQLTNTSSVRDPGLCKVVVKKDGYEDWVAEETLVQKQTWVIKAELNPSLK